ncbi:ABC transporter ATP-binding protein [Microbacterium rhizomatis]|uniref:ABC transporter ATP-binding protein n=1 Tax=Microbacterium rhizomatis TaxID=1631477 RepID=A0A5J5J0V8_9MICO|nr:ABC transporter ATP-binding protein [Microbacterium rhizomatis]KAA9108222.1 ABC transporter ATP-binding protein [Microbacterium rhizomatis]
MSDQKQTTQPDAGELAVEIVALTKEFGGLKAVDDVTITVPRQRVHGILGPNGAGKTTVLNMVSGFIRADSGSITLFGEDVTRMQPFHIARRGVARTYQNIRLFPGMTVIETVIAGAYMQRSSTIAGAILLSPTERRERKQVRARAAELLDMVGCRAPHSSLAETLSYGDQRRVEIARALATDPRILLLDEPTAGMNDVESEQIGQLLVQLKDLGLTLILIEHNMRLVEEFCETVSVMNSGAVLAEGAPTWCLEQDDVKEAYFGKRSDAARIATLRRVRRDISGP